MLIAVTNKSLFTLRLILSAVARNHRRSEGKVTENEKIPEEKTYRLEQKKRKRKEKKLGGGERETRRRVADLLRTRC